jgi:AcrR family transcriptional regulator
VGLVEAATSGVGTKELIIEVARRRFADNGFGATSLTEIADEVGIRRPSLLHHFPSKEALYEDVLRSDLADWETLVTEAVADPVGGWPQVERVVRAAFTFFEEHPEFVRLIRREALDGGPMLSGQLEVVLRPMFERGVLFLQAQMDAGRLRRYDARQLLLTGYGAALSYLSDAHLIESLLGGDPLSPAALTARREHVLDILRNALEP